MRAGESTVVSSAAPLRRPPNLPIPTAVAPRPHNLLLLHARIGRWCLAGQHRIAARERVRVVHMRPFRELLERLQKRAIPGASHQRHIASLALGRHRPGARHLVPLFLEPADVPPSELAHVTGDFEYPGLARVLSNPDRHILAVQLRRGFHGLENLPGIAPHPHDVRHRETALVVAVSLEVQLGPDRPIGVLALLGLGSGKVPVPHPTPTDGRRVDELEPRTLEIETSRRADYPVAVPKLLAGGLVQRREAINVP